MPLEFLITAGFVLVVGACALGAETFSGGMGRVAVMVAVVGAFGAWARSLVAAAATGLMAWFFATGFLVNRAGELTFSRADAVRLGALVLSGLLGSAYGVARGRWRTARRTRRWARRRGAMRGAEVLLRQAHPGSARLTRR